MDQGSLVREQIEAGERFLAEFQNYLQIKLAFWLRESEEDWKLYVVSREINDENFDVALGEVLRISGLLRDVWFDPFDVKLIGMDHPLAKGISEIERYYPDGLPPRLQGRSIGGVSVDDSYFYQLPPSAPTPTEEVVSASIRDEEASGRVPRQRGVYLLLIGPPLAPSPRFVLFSWFGQSFKVRDFIGNTVIERRAVSSPRKDSPPAGIGEMNRDEIWTSAQARIPARGELFHASHDSIWWRKKLTELTATFENRQPA